MGRIRNLWHILLGWFRKKPEPQPEASTPETPPSEAPSEPSEPRGYNLGLRKAILDELSEYFKVIRYMKAADEDNYDLYSKVGGYLLTLKDLAADQKIYMHDLSPWFKKVRPAFGCVAYADRGFWEEETKKIMPRFIYWSKFKKEKSPPAIQRLVGRGDVYVMTIFWYDKVPGKRLLSAPTDFALFVTEDGQVKALKHKIAATKTIRAKKKDRGKTFTAPCQKWDFANFHYSYAKEHNLPVEEHMIGLFCCTTQEFELAVMNSMIRVAATKGEVTAVFAVDIKRSTYLFKDRETTLTIDGRRKRIFHIVSAHPRMLGNRQTSVRIHFRGEREFTWNGYAVKITIPGLHHNDITEFNIAMHDAEMVKDHKHHIGLKEMGNLIAEHVGKTHSELKDLRRHRRV
jgi:hypothetical protein